MGYCASSRNYSKGFNQKYYSHSQCPETINIYPVFVSTLTESIYGRPSMRKTTFKYLPLCKKYDLEQSSISGDRIIRSFIIFCWVIHKTKLHLRNC